MVFAVGVNAMAKQTNSIFTCIAGVGLGGRGGRVRHGGAEEDGRVVHIDLEPIHIALIQVVDLERKVEYFMDLANTSESNGRKIL